MKRLTLPAPRNFSEQTPHGFVLHPWKEANLHTAILDGGAWFTGTENFTDAKAKALALELSRRIA